jgi:CHAT domain-containing protein
VLSACDAGRAAVWPGGEAIGMATALLRCGTATVVASVLPVPDRQAVGLVTALHEGLADGLGPAAALAAAQAVHGHLGFVCFGAG